jgi:hypothetical protein
MVDKIKLIMDLPIDKKHGCVKGSVFEVTRIEREKKPNGRAGRLRLVYFSDKNGIECGAYLHEFEFIKTE